MLVRAGVVVSGVPVRFPAAPGDAGPTKSSITTATPPLTAMRTRRTVPHPSHSAPAPPAVTVAGDTIDVLAGDRRGRQGSMTADQLNSTKAQRLMERKAASRRGWERANAGLPARND